jgi:serpin B
MRRNVLVAMRRCGALLLLASTILVLSLPLPAADPERPAPADRAVVIRGNNQFALDLYNRLRAKDGNLFFSPYSISAALAMTSVGARGQTLDEINKTLHFPEQARLHPTFAELGRAHNGAPGEKRGYELRTANRMWGQKDYGFLPELQQTLRRSYRAGIEEIDFGEVEQARQTINRWVEKETNDKIKDLLQRGVLTAQTRFALTNAIYFKGDWVSQFKKDATREGPFRVGNGKTVQAPLMHQEKAFRYSSEKTFQAVELPYVGKDVAMLVLLPKKVDGLADIEKELTPERLDTILKQLTGMDGQLTLPKFKLTDQFRLDSTLAAMGMPTAFSPGKADLSGFTGRSDLFIQAVVHKAFVEVNEEGTTAAAATVVSSGGESAPDTFVFQADHPFVFLIRDTKSGSILFLGRVSDPTK